MPECETVQVYTVREPKVDENVMIKTKILVQLHDPIKETYLADINDNKDLVSISRAES